MSMEHLKIHRHLEGLIFQILVQPRSSKNMIVGIHGEALKIKLTAPPVDNAANRMCIKFLAKSLNVSKSALEIVAGHTSRHKQILLRPDRANPSADDYRDLKQRIINLKIGS
jgi:uncharacterized protein (TIGR00251 family)